MELRGRFQYLVNQLKRGQGIELVLLQELVQQMANVQYTENLTEEQLDAMAGSETLRYQATSFGVTRNNKFTFPNVAELEHIFASYLNLKLSSQRMEALFKSTNRLRDSLLPKDEPKLAIPLLLLIAQHRSVVVINADAPYIKMVSEQFDRCHGTLLQYVEFLCSAVTPPSAYAQLIPSLDDLVHLYHLDPEVAFLIYRPVMRLFKCEGRLEVFWPLDNNETVTTTIANLEPEARECSGRVILDIGSLHNTVMWSDLLETVKTMLPSKAWNSLSPDLYATFWGLTLYDLYVPRNRYESEIAKQHAALKALEELSDNSSSAITKRKKEKERIQESLDRLTTCQMLYIVPCRLGRFLYETLKIAYYWKSDETIYERECGNMPGFAVYYRFPNSQRVTYGQFIKVHWKWSQRMSRLLIQCLESSEYMEIRNALILLTKISGVFPVTKRSGINLEKRVTRIKSDEREDLKVLATGVAAALAARKPSWVTDEEFGMGYLEIKPPSAASKSLSGNVAAAQNSSAHNVSQGPQKSKGGSSNNGPNAQSAVSLAAVHIGASRSAENQKSMDDSTNRTFEDSTVRVAAKNLAESELKVSTKRSVSKTPKQDVKDDNKSGKGVGRTLSSSISDKEIQVHLSEGRQGGAANVSSLTSNGNGLSVSGKASTMLTRTSDSYGVESKSESGGMIILLPLQNPVIKLQKRTSPAEEPDRLSKRQKGDGELRDLEGEVKFSERERSTDTRSADLDKDEQNLYRSVDKPLDRSKDKGNDRYDRDHRERSERPDKSRGDDSLADRSRDKSIERYGRELSVERGQDRAADRSFDRLADKAKDDRSKLRYNDTSAEKSQVDERFHGQNLPPPPPLPPHMVPQSVASGRRDEDADRRFGTTRHAQRLSPRHDEKERRRSEENSVVSQDDTKRRKEDDVRERKREEREGLSVKISFLMLDSVFGIWLSLEPIASSCLYAE
ncbi:hypothetical protein OIU84_017476 [Salix udensis]|uniref:THO complex subunitTHOC2 C-terminal domain-containing protein n=1 Tax=Salix udensis TaxID=889485 RepID=A0AAD6PL36_9ROSI|nr:hypothetical protein OIU84_017476 [Salix udensis]